MASSAASHPRFYRPEHSRGARFPTRTPAAAARGDRAGSGSATPVASEKRDGRNTPRFPRGALPRRPHADAVPARPRRFAQFRSFHHRGGIAGRAGVGERLRGGAADRRHRVRGPLSVARSPAARRQPRGALPGSRGRRRAWLRADTRRPGARRDLGRRIRLAHPGRGRGHLRASIRLERCGIRRSVPTHRRGLPPRRRPLPRVVLRLDTHRECVQPSQRARVVPANAVQARLLRFHDGRFPRVFLQFLERIHPQSASSITCSPIWQP